MTYETMVARARGANGVTAFVTALAHAARAATGEFAARVQRHIERHRACERLLAMTDAELKDIGLTRTEIHAGVFGTLGR